MPRNLVIFLDDGGVLNDNSLRGAEWERLLGEFFAPRLGGAPEDWAAANRAIIQGLWDKAFMDQARLGLVDRYHEWSRGYQLEWLRTMAAQAGVQAPSDEDEAIALAVEAACFVTLNCRSAYPEAAESVRAVAEAGFVLCTASGEESQELNGYLTGMGVRDCFEHLFGPNLVNAFKAGPLYYARAFETAGLEPARCLVVDDSPQALEWAASAGAATVRVDRKGGSDDGYEGHRIADLGRLLALADRLDA